MTGLEITVRELERQLGADALGWIRALDIEDARCLPAHVEQRLRIEGCIKFEYRGALAYLTRRGRKLARLLRDYDAAVLLSGRAALE